ncbi:galactokinase [Anaerolentibacter hominis]|uniref:galactokinase n=1 Tax=Anaerolentibacter hominis TaxID=3079009 RepID=UPI0031B89A26
MTEQLKEIFIEKFGPGPVRTFFAPGRVNLIGEHTDYNGGHVFPCALTIGTYGLVRKRDDRTLRFYSVNFPDDGVVETSLDDLVYQKEAGWTNYPKSVIWAFARKGYQTECGFDFLCYGTIPNGSGLSSSASLEVLTGTILCGLFGFPVDMVENSLICQMAENQYVGVNCGIMDQFAVAAGKKDHAIFLDTATLEYEYAPIRLSEMEPGYKIVIGNTNKKRGLGDSKYNERRSQCEEALAQIQKIRPVKALGDLTEAEFEEVKDAVTDPLCRKRAKHAVYENQRTIRAVKALKENDLVQFGKLMNDSHVSLRDDYEVTGRELDVMAEAAWKQEGVIGARMTGAGFGGCSVSIVRADAVDAFIESVGKEYEETIGWKADFYVVEIGDGAGELTE